MTDTLSAHFPTRDLSQLVVDERQKLVESGLLPCAPGQQEGGRSSGRHVYIFIFQSWVWPPRQRIDRR